MVRFGNHSKRVLGGGKAAFLSLLSVTTCLILGACEAPEEVEQDSSSNSKPDQKGIRPETKPGADDPNQKDTLEPKEPEGSLPSPEDQKPDPDKAKDAEDCGESKFQAEPIPPNVMLVLDKSGSMSQARWMDNGEEKTRWASLHATTKFLLESFGDKVNFGLKLFPSIQPGPGFDLSKTCHVDTGIDAACKAGNAQAILDILPKADESFMGATPTVSGLTEAYNHLASLSDPNPEVAILIVDGRTNCEQSNIGLSAIAAAAKAKDILVYVVGIDLDLATVASLAPVAIAGGTEKIYNSTDSKALASSLESIVGGITSCTIPLESTPPHPDHVKVSIGAKLEIPHLKDFISCEAAAQAGHSAGWVFNAKKAPFKQLELCGDSCSAFRAQPKVDVGYECPPPI